MSMFESDNQCLTCCAQAPGPNFLNVHDGENSSTLDVLRKHFSWFTDNDLLRGKICQACWKRVDDFHRFYVSAEELHQSRLIQFVIKIEPDSEEADYQEAVLPTADEYAVQIKEEPQEELEMLKEEDFVMEPAEEPVKRVDDVVEPGYTVDQVLNLLKNRAISITVKPVPQVDGNDNRQEPLLEPSGIVAKEKDKIKPDSAEKFPTQINDGKESGDNSVQDLHRTLPDSITVKIVPQFDGKDQRQKRLLELSETASLAQNKLEEAAKGTKEPAEGPVNENESEDSNLSGGLHTSLTVKSEPADDGEDHMEGMLVEPSDTVKDEYEEAEVDPLEPDDDDNESEDLQDLHPNVPISSKVKPEIMLDGDDHMEEILPGTSENVANEQQEESDDDSIELTEAVVDKVEDENGSRSPETKKGKRGNKSKALREVDDEYIKKHVKFVCELCGVDIPFYSKFILHFKTEHSSKSAFVTCCGRRYYNKNRLYNHVQTINNPDTFRCQVCAKNFNCREGFRKHMQIFHANSNFTCDRCSKSFATKYLYRKHINQDVCSEKEWTCEHCGKTYRTRVYLNKHISQKHPESPQYTCDICSKVFYQKEWLKNHMQKHECPNGLRMQCEVCSIWLKNPKSWGIHVREAHQDIICAICDNCGFVAPNLDKLQEHIDESHG